MHLLAAWLLGAGGLQGDNASVSFREIQPGLEYLHESLTNVPWSIHVVRVDRLRADLKLVTTLAQGMLPGISTITEQVRSLPPAVGQPIAAINGDFFVSKVGPYQGDPRGLHICQGELVSAPTETPCFWMDAGGQPHLAEVKSFLKVLWPGGWSTPVGLNQKRRDNEAVAYTPAFGLSTPTKNGREIVLGSGGPGAWLPLRVGSNYVTQVLEVRERGNTRLEPERVVLSLGPKTSSRIPTLRPGMTVRLLTATSPGLAGTDTAMGGNWILVKEGKPNPALSLARRDPRTAIGWNQRHLFLVVVDGRQSGLSAGMTPSELAEYLAGLGCQNAMNLDGGGSSTLWLEGQVRNSPSEGIQRRVANALLVVKPPIASPKPTPTRP